MKKNFLDNISSFTLILIMVILMIIGVALIPMIHISYYPSRNDQQKNLSVGFSWGGASPRVIEQEVTSKIEGLVSSVNGVSKVSSVSGTGSGSVTMELKKGANISAVRFEISSLLKQIAPKLPDGVSYPTLSESGVGGLKSTTKTLLSYQINADMGEDQIEDYAKKNIKPYIELIDGVSSVNISGATSKYMEITYDPIVLSNYGMNASTISNGIGNFLGRTNIVGDVERVDENGEKNRITLLLSTSKLESDIAKIPLDNVDGKIIYLGDLTSVTFKDVEPQSYYRINGLNTIYLNISVDADVNLISKSEEVQQKMEAVKANLVDNFYVTLTDDAAKEIKSELHKLVRRTVLSLLILLFFGWIVSRSMR
ncbi:MAG: efflux RND transporter permease subunit [Rikenellaceae bacterium]